MRTHCGRGVTLTVALQSDAIPEVACCHISPAKWACATSTGKPLLSVLLLYRQQHDVVCNKVNSCDIAKRQAHLPAVVDGGVVILDLQLAGSHVEVDGHLDCIGLQQNSTTADHSIWSRCCMASPKTGNDGPGRQGRKRGGIGRGSRRQRRIARGACTSTVCVRALPSLPCWLCSSLRRILHCTAQSGDTVPYCTAFTVLKCTAHLVLVVPLQLHHEVFIHV